MKKPSKTRFLLLIPLLIILAALIYQIPFVKDRLSWRIDELKTRLTYALNPPDEAVFIPGGETSLATPVVVAVPETAEPTLEDTNTDPTAVAPDQTVTPLPEQAILDGVVGRRAGHAIADRHQSAGAVEAGHQQHRATARLSGNGRRAVGRAIAAGLDVLAGEIAAAVEKNRARAACIAGSGAPGIGAGDRVVPGGAVTAAVLVAEQAGLQAIAVIGA